MDIRVGGSPAVGGSSEKSPGAAGAVEARVLAIRSPRRRGTGSRSTGPERRSESAPRDPLTGRVLVLLIPDGSSLPEGLESGSYRVFLRFARK